jgi:protein-S-isoprenylcysteine O-methyltransferase Ste14
LDRLGGGVGGGVAVHRRARAAGAAGRVGPVGAARHRRGAWLLTHGGMAAGGAGRAVLGGLWAAVGAVLLVAGTAFTLWARVVLGRMWSSAPTVKEGHALQTGGPYAVTRHPIYTGMLAMAAGSVLLDGRLRILLVGAVFLGYVLLKIRVEERLMVETFGERYRGYRRRTPQLVPGLGGRGRAG